MFHEGVVSDEDALKLRCFRWPTVASTTTARGTTCTLRCCRRPGGRKQRADGLERRYLRHSNESLSNDGQDLSRCGGGRTRADYARIPHGVWDWPVGIQSPRDAVPRPQKGDRAARSQVYTSTSWWPTCSNSRHPRPTPSCPRAAAAVDYVSANKSQASFRSLVGGTTAAAARRGRRRRAVTVVNGILEEALPAGNRTRRSSRTSYGRCAPASSRICPRKRNAGCDGRCGVRFEQRSSAMGGGGRVGRTRCKDQTQQARRGCGSCPPAARTVGRRR